VAWVILDHDRIMKDIVNILNRDALFHHFLVRMLRDTNGIAVALLPKAASNGVVVLNIHTGHCP